MVMRQQLLENFRDYRKLTAIASGGTILSYFLLHSIIGQALDAKHIIDRSIWGFCSIRLDVCQLEQCELLHYFTL